MAGAAMSTSSSPGNSASRRARVSRGDVVELDAEAADAGGELADRVEVVVALPVGVGEIRSEGAPRRLSAIDAGRDRGRGLGDDDEAVAAAELALEEVGVGGDDLGAVRGEVLKPFARRWRGAHPILLA
jgi:hypothetical protein